MWFIATAVIICLTLPILKRHLCWSFQTQQHVLCPCNELLNCALDKKKQMLPFSDVVNHTPLSEQKGTTPCEQERLSTLVLTSTYPLLRTCRTISCPTTNLCQDCFRRNEKKPACDLSAKTICETLIKSQQIVKPLLRISAADSLDRCRLMSFKELIVSAVLERFFQFWNT